ncbi:MAG: MotA/TolQ/ExbB proton channel family protein [Bacteriovoracaceae bacterium]|nr:MotA/TolQ/ExbB proton channel family protein [Bacteriovoracaceae bacterium]
MNEELSTLDAIIKFLKEGDMFLWLIIFQWCCGMAIGVMKFLKLRYYQVDSASFLAETKKFVLHNEVQYAIQLCSRSSSLLARVFKVALMRVNQSRQQIQDVVEASLIECQRNASSHISWLGLLANFSTLFGLLGTIHGLIISFSAVAGVDPSEKAKILALGIATAMNATAVGIMAAISLLLFHNFLHTKIHHMLSELDEYSMRLIDLIGTRKNEEYRSTDHVA